MKQKLLCIELTSIELKVCEVEFKHKTNEVVVLNTFSISLNNNVSDTEIYEIDSLAYSVKEELQRNNIKTKKCVVSINSNDIYSRSVSIPFQKTSQDILKLINAKVENEDIFSASDLSKSTTTYSILDKVVRDVDEVVDEEIIEDKESKKKKKKSNNSKLFDYNVMLYNAPNSLINGVTELIHSCGLKLVSINYSGNSIYQYIRNEHKDGTYLVVYLNDINSILSVVKDGVLISQKTDEFSYKKVLDKLISHQDITNCSSVDEALNFINESRFFEDDYELNHDLLETQQDTFYYMRQEIIDDIVGFFDIIKAYLTSTRNITTVDKIVYISNNENFPDLTESIRVNIGIDVESYNEKELGYSVSLIDCVNSCISPINFNIEESNKVIENRKIGQYTAVGLVFTLWISAIYVGYNIFTLSNLKLENKKLEADILAANEAQVIFNEYQQSVMTKETIDLFDLSSTTILNDLDTIIKEIESAVPSGKLHINSLSSSLDSISLSVTADSKDTIAYFIENLEKIEYFKYIDTSSVSETIAEEGGETQFSNGREVITTIVCSFLPEVTEEEATEVVEESVETETESEVE